MSSPDTDIRVSNLGKMYRIGVAQKRHDTLAGHAKQFLASPFRYLRTKLRPMTEQETLWALKDVSFEVRRGEVLGIIGRNGAGKSTLLKILSRITDPTEGRAWIRGRVNSLLEVGTGFHPELTGRENIYMNAAMHGMTRREISRKMDEIIAFAEVERFIETPVKRYSSGMYTRLAFAVAAHLDPDVLLIDEVLAVGDISFQKKCLGKMDDVAHAGRTIIFVSHNMAAISTLCRRLIFLDRGRVAADGPTEEVIPLYVAEGGTAIGSVEWPDPATAPGDDKIRLRAVRVRVRGGVTGNVTVDDPVIVEVEYCNLRRNENVMVALHVTTRMGVLAFLAINAPSASLNRDPWFGEAQPEGVYRTECLIPPYFLNVGEYRLKPAISTEMTHVHAQFDDAVTFTVHETGSMRQEYTKLFPGVVRPRFEWRTKRIEG